MNKKSILEKTVKNLSTDQMLVKEYKRIVSSGDGVLDDFVSIAIIIHKKLDELFDNTLSMYLMGNNYKEDKYNFVRDNILTAITFQNKIIILRKLGHLKDKKIRVLAGAIGTLRNECAHTRRIEKLVYNQKVFDNYTNLIHDAIEDYLKIGKHFDEFNRKNAKVLFESHIRNPYVEALIGR